MIKKPVTILIILSIIINMTACNYIKKQIRYEAEFLELFDTVTTIVGYAESKEKFTSITQSIYDNLKEYHELYDIYNDYDGINNIKTINDNAGVKPVKVDKKIIDLLLFSKDAYKFTKGKTNIAFGSVLKIWHDYRTAGVENPENAELPPVELLKEASLHTNIDNIIIDENNSTVFLNDSKMSLDVGAVAKGYAAEQVSRAARENGLISGLVSVGGNVCAIGSKADNNKKWNVGIQNPDKENQNSILHTVDLSDEALVTSGNYERYYTVNGKKYNHIINTETLFPADYFAAVTIICEDSGKADALSTALFDMPLEEGKKIIESISDTEAMWVYNDGKIEYSKNFKDYIKK